MIAHESWSYPDKMHTPSLFVMDALRVPLSLISRDYLYEAANKAYCDVHGKSRASVIGATVAGLWGQEKFAKIIKRQLDRCFAGEEVHDEDWIDFPALGKRYCEVVYSPYPAKSWPKTHAIVLTYDLTERKRMEEAYKNSEQRFRDLSEASLEAIVFIDAGNVVIDANKALSRLFGYEDSEVRGKPASLFIAPERREASERRMKARLEGKYETVGIKKDSSTFPIGVNPREFVHKGQRLRISAVRDLTERKKWEEELRRYENHLEKLVDERTRELKRSEEKYRDIFENAVEGIFQSTPDGRLLHANPALARMFGYPTPQELIENVTDIGDLYVRREDRSKFMSLLEEEGVALNFEAEFHCREGAPRWACLNARAVKGEDGRSAYYEGTLEDVNERKRIEQALRESEERYRTVVEHSNDGIVIARRGRHLYINRKYVQMFGYDREEDIIGEKLLTMVHPDERGTMEDIGGDEAEDTSVPSRFEFRGVRKDGTILYVEASLAKIVYQGRPALLAFMRDVTERRHTEEASARTRTELEQLNIARTKAIHHIAHEMKTPLALIQACVKLLKRRLEKAGIEARAATAVFQKNIDRLLSISRDSERILAASRENEAIDLLDESERFWRRVEHISDVPPDLRLHMKRVLESVREHRARDERQKILTDPCPLVLETLNRVKTEAQSRNVDFNYRGPEGVYLRMPRLVIGEALESLLRNAVENTPDGGMVEVALEPGPDAAAIHIRDTGVGITEENQKYIFGGLLHTARTDLYSSGQPYSFRAGGKGMELFLIKLNARRYGFGLSMKSRRCIYIPHDDDLCPGSILSCPYCRSAEDCFRSGGSCFSLLIPRNIT